MSKILNGNKIDMGTCYYPEHWDKSMESQGDGSFDSFSLESKEPSPLTLLVKTLSMTGAKRQTITPDDFRQLAKDFGVSLPEKFLFEK